MVRIKTGKCSSLRAAAVAVAMGLLASANFALGQEISQMGTTELKSEAVSLVGAKKYVEARPYLKELIGRLSEVNDKKLKAEMHELYFFYAFGFFQDFLADPTKTEYLDSAVKNLDKVITEYPNTPTAMQAIRLKANCYDIAQKPVESAKVREMMLQSPFVEKINIAEQNDLIKKIAEAYYAERDWENAKKWFEILFARATNLNDRVFAASGMIQYMANKKDIAGIEKYLKEMVYNVPPRYDIELNIAFLRVGDELVKQDKYGLATLIYSLVFSKQTIIEYYKEMLDALKAQLAILKIRSPNHPKVAELENRIAMFEFKLKLVESVKDYDSDLMLRVARNYQLTNREYESFWAYRQLIRSFPEHDAIQDFYLSAFFGAQRIGKKDTMYEIGQEYLQKFPDGDYIHPILLHTARYFLDKGDKSTFYSMAEDFIAKYNEESNLCADFVYLMGATWVDDMKYDELIKTFGNYIKKYPDTSVMEGSYYWSGIAYISKSKFEEAIKMFDSQLEEYPQGLYTEDAIYRKGIAEFGLGKFKESAETFEKFIADYADSKIRGEVEFFLGDIYAGAGDEKTAMSHYMAVEKYTKNKSFIDRAYTQAAKLLHMLEKYNEEIALMDKYLENFPKGICSEAIFNKSAALEKLGFPADALELYTGAIEKYGSNPFDDGVDRMILDFNRLGESNKVKTIATIAFLEKCMSDRMFLYNMVEKPSLRYRYFQANPNVDYSVYERFKRDTTFGLNLYNDKTNLEKLLAQYKAQLKKYPSSTEDVFKRILANAQAKNDETLANRMMMGLDALGKPVATTKMFEDSDMKKSSVRTLVWIGQINAGYSAESARKAYQEARSRDEIEYLIDVLFAQAALEERESNWDKVLSLYQEIEDGYPGDTRAARAAISHADTLMKLGKKDKAKAKYEEILQTPAWRDAAFAEVLCKLGDLAASENNTNDALMMYERCYLGFSNVYKWTGKALLSAAKLMAMEGKNAEAIAICDEFIANPKNKASPEYSEIETYRQSL